MPCGGLVAAIHPKINIYYQACRHYLVNLIVAPFSPKTLHAKLPWMRQARDATFQSL